VLSDTLGYRAPFFAIAGACVVGGMVSLLLVEDASERSGTLSARALLAPVLRSRKVLIACLITVVTTTGFGLLEPTLPIYLKSTFSMSRTMIGVVFGVTMAAYAFAARWRASSPTWWAARSLSWSGLSSQRWSRP
jgi:predicted MFS family arabinose efflux permease